VRRIDSNRLKVELRRAVRPLTLFVLLVAAGAVSAGVIFKNQTFQKPWEDYYEVRAEFADAKGVVPGSQQVRIAGVRVGIIKGTELEHGRAIVRLSIQSKYGRLYRDARLRLRPSTPLQDMYVAVEDRGTPAAGKLGEDDVLRAQSTETPVDVARVLNVFDVDTRKRLDVLLDGLGQGLDDRGAALRTAFVQAAPFFTVAQRATGVLARRRAATKRLVANLGRLTDTLGDRNRRITGLVRDGERTLGALARNDAPLAATVRELPATLSAVRSSFAATRSAQDQLDPALVALDPVLDRLEPGLRALERFGDDARPALAALKRPVRTLQPLARDLQPAARALNAAMGPLADQTPEIDRITGLLPNCLERLSAFFTNTMSLGKFEDEGGVVPRSETTFSADSLSPLLGNPPEPSFERKPTCTPGGQRP
jgi:virulence factor Mce-like protein